MLAAGDELVGVDRGAEERRRDGRGNLGLDCVVGELHEEAAVGGAEEGIRAKGRSDLDAHAVADAHLEHRLGDAAVAQRGDRERIATLDQALDQAIGVEKRLGIGGEAVVGVVGHEHRDAVAGALELGGDHAVHVAEAVAKETSVGGTSRSSKLPDMSPCRRWRRCPDQPAP